MPEVSAAQGPGGSPKLPRWDLAPGNIVKLVWVNARMRTVRNDGCIVQNDGTCIWLGQNSFTAIDRATQINIDRIRIAEVVVEGDAAKDVRKRVWELLRETASHTNKRSAWEKDDFFRSLRAMLALLPPEEIHNEEGP